MSGKAVALVFPRNDRRKCLRIDPHLDDYHTRGSWPLHIVELEARGIWLRSQRKGLQEILKYAGCSIFQHRSGSSQ
jgi:hypothetical protein